MVTIKKAKSILDRSLDYLLGTMIVAMTLIIIYQIFTRNFLDFTPRWTEELALLLLIWIAFIGIAIGFRDNLHIGVGVFVGLMPKTIQKKIDLITKVLVIAMSIIFIYYGFRFTFLMHGSLMAGTGLPQSFLYSAIPVSGILTFIYGVEMFFKDAIHEDFDDDAKEAMEAAK